MQNSSFSCISFARFLFLERAFMVGVCLAVDGTDDKSWKEWDQGTVGAEWACQKADVWRGRCSEGGAGVVAVYRLGRGKLADGAQRRGERTETEKRSRHASYVMIIRKYRGRLFSAAPGWGDTRLGPWAGVQGGETWEKVGCGGGGETPLRRKQGSRKDKLDTDQRWVLIKRLKDRHEAATTAWLQAIARHSNENGGQKTMEDSGAKACWKLFWTLASLRWLDKVLRQWKTVCLPAFICMVRCQYKTSSVSEESEGSMARRGERNWIAVTLSWPFITRTHTCSVTCLPDAHFPSNIHLI